MTEAGDTRRIPGMRTAALLLVVLTHGELVYLLTQDPSWNRRSAPPGEPPLQVVLLQPNAAVEVSKPDLPGARPRIVRPPAAPTPSPPPTRPVDTTTNAITLSQATPDWHAQAEQVAGEETTGSQGQHGFDHAMPAKPKPVTGVFAPAPAHLAGTWADPDTYYATDECHFEFDRSARPPPTALDRGLQTLRCKPPIKGGGGDLFKDLKPAYLDPDHPPPVP